MVMAAQAQAVNAASDGGASVHDTKADTEMGMVYSRMSWVSFLSDSSQGSTRPLNP